MPSNTDPSDLPRAEHSQRGLLVIPHPPVEPLAYKSMHDQRHPNPKWVPMGPAMLTRGRSTCQKSQIPFETEEPPAQTHK